MEAPMKCICLIALLVIVGVAGLGKVESRGGCRYSNPDREALKLAPCAAAAQDEKVAVSNTCCLEVQNMAKSPRCLCAVLLSLVSKNSAATQEIAVTIPKRCNLADRPVGYQCGAYNFN